MEEDGKSKSSRRTNWNRLQAAALAFPSVPHGHHLRQYVSGLFLFNYLKVRAGGGLSQKQCHMALVEQRKHCTSDPNILTSFFQWPQRWWLFSAPGPLLHKHNYQGTQEGVQENQISQKLRSQKGNSSQHTPLSSLQLRQSQGTPGQASGRDSHARPAQSPPGVLQPSLCASCSRACPLLRTYRHPLKQLESQLARARSKRSWIWMKAKWWMLTLPTDRNQEQKLVGNPCISALSGQCWPHLGKKAKARSTSVLPPHG